MTATLKFIHTRPSLSDLFEIEFGPRDLIDRTPNNHADAQGFISGSYDEMITAAEIKSRKSELETIRPDLAEILWPTEDECILDLIIDPAHPFYIPDSNFFINPFSLTYTESYTFNSLEDIKEFARIEGQTFDSNSESYISVKNTRKAAGLTLRQQVLVDGVDVTSSCDWLLDIE